jgi:hypothetical protein
MKIYPAWPMLLLALGLPVNTSSHAEGVLEGLLGFLGITASPSQMKSPSDVIDAGEIWIVPLADGNATQVGREAGYRWPIFAPGGESILALASDTLVSIPVTGGPPKTLHRLPGVEKLIGFAKDDDDRLLLLKTNQANGSAIGVLSLASGKIADIPHDPRQDRRALAHLRGHERVYDQTKLYLKTETKPSVTGGQTEWIEIYAKQGEAPPRAVSRCDGSDCVQPSLSGDGTKVVFIKRQR